MEIAVVLDFSPADVDEIEHCATPSLKLLQKMEQKNQLSESNIEELISAMNAVHLQGPAENLQNFWLTGQGM